MTKSNSFMMGVLLLILTLGLYACNLPGVSQGDDLSVEEQAQTIVAQTNAAIITEEGDVGGDEETGGDVSATPLEVTVTPSPTQTEMVVPTDTLTPTITLTATQDKPLVSVSVDTNCRKGPGKIYDIIGALLVGEDAEVVGKSADGEYWVIKNPDYAGECWLWAYYATVTGPTEGLPKFTPPPTPTPSFVWEGSWTTYIDEGGPALNTYAMTITVTDMTFNGYIDLGGGGNVTLTGTVHDDHLAVEGTWTSTSGTNGTFEFFSLGANQFQGNISDGVDVGAWCGSRAGAGQPSPCLKN